MKKLFLLFTLSAMLLFSSCSQPSTVDPAAPEEEDEQSTPIDDDGVEGNEELDSLFEINDVSYSLETTWQDTVYEQGLYSVSYPAEWTPVDGETQGLYNGTFFLPPDADPDNFRFGSHVAIEAMETPFYQVADFSDASVQEDFFAQMLVTTHSKMGGLSDLQHSVWQCGDTYVYIVDYIRSNDTLTMYQTEFYIMHPDVGVVVYATTFGEDSTPSVQETAHHLVSTFQLT